MFKCKLVLTNCTVKKTAMMQPGRVEQVGLLVSQSSATSQPVFRDV